MRKYTLQATLSQSTTTVELKARDTYGAKVLAVAKINANHVADKRYAQGEVTLKDETGKVVWRIRPEETITTQMRKEVK